MKNTDLEGMLDMAASARATWPAFDPDYAKAVSPDRIIALGARIKAQDELLERTASAMEYLMALANDPFPSPHEALLRDIRHALYTAPASRFLYRCPDSQRVHELLGDTEGAGACKGQTYKVYRDLDSGTLYHQTTDAFYQHMHPFREEG